MAFIKALRTPASRVPDFCIAARPSRSWRRSQTIDFIRRAASLSIEPGSVALSAPASAKPTFVRVHLPQRPQLKLPSGFSQQTRKWFIAVSFPPMRRIFP